LNITRVKNELPLGSRFTFHVSRCMTGPYGDAARRVRTAQGVGFLPDTFLGIVWRFEFIRVGQGTGVRPPLALLINSTSFSRSPREGF
jgi:hypothetical protein